MVDPALEVLGKDDRDTGSCDWCGTEDGTRYRIIVTATFDGVPRRCFTWRCAKCRREAWAAK